MAENADATPKKGRITKLELQEQNAALQMDNARLERESKEQKAVTGLWRFGAALVLAVIVVIGGIYTLVNRGDAPAVASETTVTVDPAAQIDQEPFNPEGVQSWAEWEQVATPEQREALLAMSEGVITSELTAKWAAEEVMFGRSFQVELPPGTPITNTGINSNGWYSLDYTVKEGDTAFLATDKGEPVVKQSCGNPVGPPGVKGPNPFPNWIGDHQASVPTPGPTPGYPGPGNAERVYEDQYSQPIGGLDDTPYGTPGDGAGGVTPPSPTEQPDGTVILTPPSPEPPNDTPPPLADVPDGGVVAKPTN